MAVNDNAKKENNANESNDWVWPTIQKSYYDKVRDPMILIPSLSFI